MQGGGLALQRPSALPLNVSTEKTGWMNTRRVWESGNDRRRGGK